MLDLFVAPCFNSQMTKLVKDFVFELSWNWIFKSKVSLSVFSLWTKVILLKLFEIVELSPFASLYDFSRKAISSELNLAPHCFVFNLVFSVRPFLFRFTSRKDKLLLTYFRIRIFSLSFFFLWWSEKNLKLGLSK